MTDYVVGPGVAQAIADAGDEARSDERFIILDEGHQVSETICRDSIFYWIQEDNAVRRVSF